MNSCSGEQNVSGVVGQGPPIRTYKRNQKIKTEVISKEPQKTAINDFITLKIKQEVVEVEITQPQEMRNLNAVKGELNETETGYQEVKVKPDDNVRVKEEIVHERLRLDEEELYVGHEVKKEQVIAPEMLQKPLELIDNSFGLWHGCEQATSSGSERCRSAVEKGRAGDAKKKHYHIQIKQSGTRRCCNICGLVISKSYNLKKHMRTHTGDKSYNCDVCKKRFYNGTHFRNHIQIHTGYKPYSCVICNRDFNEIGNLRHHMRIHTGDKSYSCNICNKCFTESNSLKIHKRIHTGEKPYSCDTCYKCFTENSSLTRHMRTHTGDKPYSCDICYKCFTESSSLKRHIRTHTGDKPYSCQICGKKFIERSSVTKHMRGHTGDKPYSCDVCNKCYTQSNSLKRHMRTHR